MPGYEIKRKKDKFYFVLYPSNSNTQELGASIEYNTRKECEDAIEKFKIVVKSNRAKFQNRQYAKEFLKQCEIVDENNNCIFIRRNTSSPKVNMDSIYRNIEGKLK